MDTFPRSEGRTAFGENPSSYDQARPAYAEWLFERLRARCELRPGTAVFEVGAGTGRVTRRLLEMGACPLVAIEPDPRLVEFMRNTLPMDRVELISSSFEDAAWGEIRFDLGVAATSFHWIDEMAGLYKVAALLNSGGWWAMWWQSFGDIDASDAFHMASNPLLSPLQASPSDGPTGRPPFALDFERRLAALEAAGEFEEAGAELVTEPHVFSAAQIRRLYASFSNITRLPLRERERILDGLERLAIEEFADRVVRPVTTVLYTARRR